jgi:phosphoribosylformylglycinamidine cyclo-ligase
MRYKDAGVDIDAANEAKRRIARMVKDSFGDSLPVKFGGFGSLFKPDFGPGDEAFLVSSVDSVGTKVKVAIMAGKHDTVGIDIVNHCVNDILVCGATPLFFLDYIATGKLNPDTIESIVSGLVKACADANCALIGGETAEMPGLYADGDYDLVGFIVGKVTKPGLIDGSGVKEGDVLVGLASSGLHTNGYSLARKVFFDKCRFTTDTYIEEIGSTAGEALLAAHTSYLRPVVDVMKKVRIKALAHITGGGFFGNLPRVFPGNLDAIIKVGSWPVPPIFEFIRREGSVPADDMYRTFNMGIGMVITVSAEESSRLVSELKGSRTHAFEIGFMARGSGKAILKGV